MEPQRAKGQEAVRQIVGRLMGVGFSGPRQAAQPLRIAAAGEAAIMGRRPRAESTIRISARHQDTPHYPQ